MSKNYNFVKYEKMYRPVFKARGFQIILFLPPKILISENSEVFLLKIKTFGWI
jgi:predicted deacetylase